MTTNWKTPRYRAKTLNGLNTLKQKNLNAKMKTITCQDCEQITPHNLTCVHCGEGLISITLTNSTLTNWRKIK